MRSSLEASQFQLQKTFAYFSETLSGNYAIPKKTSVYFTTRTQYKEISAIYNILRS